MTVPAIPDLAAYKTAMQLWNGHAHTFLDASPVGTYSDSIANQYDPAIGRYYAMDTTGDTATWTSRVTRAWQETNDYVNVKASPAGAIAVYLMHIDGFLSDYNRGVTRSPTSAANINAILTNGGYMTSDFGDPLSTQEYSREVAHVLICHIYAGLVGISLSGAQTTRRELMKTYAMGHLDIWANNTGTYCRPFMAAITCRALIAYYTYVSADAEIITKIKAIANYIRTNCWKSASGSWGDGQSFLYTDRFVVDSDDLRTAPDLNAIITPLFWWITYQTGETSYRTWGDECFSGGIPVYSGSVRLSGADMGTPASPSLKRVNQQTYWTPAGIVYREAEPLRSDPSAALITGTARRIYAATSSLSRPMANPWPLGFSRQLAPTAVVPYDPSTFFTGGTKGPWYDAGSSTTILDAGGAPASNLETVATVNDSGTAAINASQATDANRPTLAAAHQNSRNALLVDTTDYLDATGLNAFTNSMTSMTILAVYRPTDDTTNHCMLRQYDTSYSYDRYNALFIGLKPSIKYSKDGGDFANLRTGATDLSAANYHALIFQVDCTNGQTGIFADNATYLAVAAAGGGTVAGAMNATSGNESRFLRTAKGYCLDLYVHKNALMTAGQRSDWFAAVKSRFALSTY